MDEGRVGSTPPWTTPRDDVTTGPGVGEFAQPASIHDARLVQRQQREQTDRPGGSRAKDGGGGGARRVRARRIGRGLTAVWRMTGGWRLVG